MASACARAVTPAFCCQHCAIRRPTSPGSPATSARSVGPAPLRKHASAPLRSALCEHVRHARDEGRPIRLVQPVLHPSRSRSKRPACSPARNNATRPTLKTASPLGTMGAAPVSPWPWRAESRESPRPPAGRPARGVSRNAPCLRPGSATVRPPRSAGAMLSGCPSSGRARSSSSSADRDTPARAAALATPPTTAAELLPRPRLSGMRLIMRTEMRPAAFPNVPGSPKRPGRRGSARPGPGAAPRPPPRSPSACRRRRRLAPLDLVIHPNAIPRASNPAPRFAVEAAPARAPIALCPCVPL